MKHTETITILDPNTAQVDMDGRSQPLVLRVSNGRIQDKINEWITTLPIDSTVVGLDDQDDTIIIDLDDLFGSQCGNARLDVIFGLILTGLLVFGLIGLIQIFVFTSSL